jgi:hypothetical protein
MLRRTTPVIQKVDAVHLQRFEGDALQQGSEVHEERSAENSPGSCDERRGTKRSQHLSNRAQRSRTFD